MVCNCTQYGRKYGEKHNVFSPLFGSWSGSHHWPHLSVLSSSSVPSNDMASQGTEAHKASQGIRQLYGLQNPLLRVLNIHDLAMTYCGSCCPVGRVPCLQRGPGCPPVGCCSGLGCGTRVEPAPVEALELLCYHHHCKNSHRMGIYLVEGLKTIATCWFDLLTWLNIRLHASFFTSRNQFAIFFVLLSNISKKKHK